MDIYRIIISFAAFVSISIISFFVIKSVLKMIENYQKAYVNNVSTAMREMFIFVDPQKMFQNSIICASCFLLLGALLIQNLYSPLLFGVFGFFLPRWILWFVGKRRINQFADQLLDGLVLLANAIRSGMTLQQAIELLERETSPPISQEFGLVIRECAVGLHIEEALENLVHRMPNLDLNLIVTSTNIILQTGGNLVDIFDTLADLIRERQRLELKTKSLTAQGKLQSIIIGLLPTIVGVCMYMIEPRMVTRLFTTLMGNLCLALIIILQATGFIIIKKITNVEY